MLLPKHDLHSDHTSRYAKVDREISQGPTLDEEPQAAEGRGGLIFPKDEPLMGYPIPSGQS